MSTVSGHVIVLFNTTDFRIGVDYITLSRKKYAFQQENICNGLYQKVIHLDIYKQLPKQLIGMWSGMLN